MACSASADAISAAADAIGIAPAIGATNIGSSVQGRMRRPAQRRVALHRLQELGQQEDRAEHPEVHQERETFASANARFWKKRRGSIGAACAAPTDERHQQRGAEASDAEDLGWSSLSVAADDPLDDAEQAGADEAEAGKVQRAGRAVALAQARQASGTSTRPIGTLSQKIQCQEMPSTTRRRPRGPSATARPPMPPSAERQAARSAGTAALRMVSVSGRTIAPPSPAGRGRCERVAGARAAARGEREDAHADTNMRRRPKRSPSAAPVSSSTAKVSV